LHPIVSNIRRVVKLNAQQLSQRIDVLFVAMLRIVFKYVFTRRYTLLQTHPLNLCFCLIGTLTCISPHFDGILSKFMIMWRNLQIDNLGRSSRRHRMFSKSCRKNRFDSLLLAGKKSSCCLMRREKSLVTRIRAR
jgi:hypothetical protein